MDPSTELSYCTGNIIKIILVYRKLTFSLPAYLSACHNTLGLWLQTFYTTHQNYKTIIVMMNIIRTNIGGSNIWQFVENMHLMRF